MKIFLTSIFFFGSIQFSFADDKLLADCQTADGQYQIVVASAYPGSKSLNADVIDVHGKLAGSYLVRKDQYDAMGVGITDYTDRKLKGREFRLTFTVTNLRTCKFSATLNDGNRLHDDLITCHYIYMGGG